MSFAGPIIRQGLRSTARYVYQGLRQQERIIDYTYRRTGLYNRGVVRGIKHGLAGGQIIGGGLSLGLNTPDGIGNDAVSYKKRIKPSTYKQNKTRSRSTRSNRNCYPIRRSTNRYRGRTRYRKRY